MKKQILILATVVGMATFAIAQQAQERSANVPRTTLSPQFGPEPVNPQDTYPAQNNAGQNVRGNDTWQNGISNAWFHGYSQTNSVNENGYDQNGK